MECPNCGSTCSSIYDSRPKPSGVIARKRVCESCKTRWKTYEIAEGAFEAALVALDAARRQVDALMGGRSKRNG